MAKGKGAKRDGQLTRINFSKTAYATEEAVQKFLDDNDITDCEIVDEGDVFAAKSTAADLTKLEKPVTMTTKHAGVTAFVAQPKAAEADPEEGEADGGALPPETADGDTGKEPVEADKVIAAVAKPQTKNATKAKVVDGTEVAKGDDTDTELKFPANKYDWWGAYMSNEGSLLGVLKDGIDYDGLPPGVDEIMSAVYTSAGNVLSSSDDSATKKTKLGQIGDDFAALTFGLFEMFERATDDSTKSANTDRKAKAAAFAESFSASVTRAANGEPPVFGDNVIAPKGAKKGVTVIDTLTGEEQDDPADALANLTAIIGKAVGDAVAPINTRLGVIEEATKSVSDDLARSTSRRSDASAIDALGLGDEIEDEEVAEAKRASDATLDNVRRIFGGRPKSNA